MAKYSPQYNLFKTINKLASKSQFVFWTVLALSIAPVVFKEFCETQKLMGLINVFNIIGISLFFTLEVISDYILIPHAESKRRDDFIDNSFGSLFSPNNSVGYYDNEEVNTGLYKAAVNLFENCFFTYSLVKDITSYKIVSPVIMLLFMTSFAYYGFKEIPFALSVLQALFSANILGSLIKHMILLNRLTTILDSWIALFQHKDLKANMHKYQTSVYRYWLQYEVLLSKIKTGISEKRYNEHNPSLTEEWKKMKSKYNIS